MKKTVLVFLGVIALCGVSVFATSAVVKGKYEDRISQLNNDILEYKNNNAYLSTELAIKEGEAESLAKIVEDMRESEVVAEESVTEGETTTVEVAEATETETTEPESKAIRVYELPPEKDRGALSAYETPVILVEYEGYRYGYLDTALNLITAQEGIAGGSHDYAILIQAAYEDRTAGFAVSYVIRRGDEVREEMITYEWPDDINHDGWHGLVPEEAIIKLEEGEYIHFLQ